MLSLFARLTYYQIVFETQTHASEPPMFQPVQSRIVMRKHQRLRRGIIVSRPFQFPDQNIEFGSETEVRELHFSLLSCRGYVFVNIFILVSVPFIQRNTTPRASHSHWGQFLRQLWMMRRELMQMTRFKLGIECLRGAIKRIVLLSLSW
jgi:hypothetical protein